MSDAAQNKHKSDITPETPARLRVEGISKSYRHVTALSDVSVEIGQGEVVGLVGENGAGKSTLLNILTGTVTPDEGSIYVDGTQVTLSNPRDAARKGISMVHQEQEIISNLTGYENLFLGREDNYTKAGIIQKERMKHDAQEVLDALGISLPIEARLEEYSFNQRQMLEIAKAFSLTKSANAPVVLLDEPTAGLEEAGREKLFRLINELRKEGSFVFVSHELDEVIEIADRIYVLKDGKLVDQVAASDTSEESLQESMVGRERASEYYKIADQQPTDELEAVKLSVDDVSRKESIGPLSLDVREGEVLGVVGVDGSGKERLGRLLAGDLQPDEGTITIDGSEITDHSVATMIDHGVGYVPKERKSDGLLLYQSVQMNVSLPTVEDMHGNLPLLDLELETELSHDTVEQLNVKTPGIETLVHTLSGGNQQKIVLGRWLARDASILVMDNVTRGIDVGAKEEVYRICRELTDSGVSIIFIGDELPEVIGMANRIAVMKDGRVVDVLSAPRSEKPDENDIIKEMV